MFNDTDPLLLLLLVVVVVVLVVDVEAAFSMSTVDVAVLALDVTADETAAKFFISANAFTSSDLRLSGGFIVISSLSSSNSSMC